MSLEPSITLAAVADLVAGALEGDGSRVIRRVAPLADAGPDAISWLGSPKYLSQLGSTRAGGVLVPRRCEAPPGLAVVRVDDPELAMCAVLKRLGPAPAAVPPGVDPRAVVDPTARVSGAAIGPLAFVGPSASIGAGTQIHPGVYIGAEATIGRDCVLWPNVVVRERCRLGDRVVVHPNATIGADGFGYLPRGGKHHKIPQVGVVVIDDDVEIGAGTTIDRARSGVTRIGRGTKIDNLVQIGHNCEIGEDCIIVAQCGVSGSTTMGRNVVLAGQVGLVDHLTIGDGARIAAQTGLAQDVPAGAAFGGSPGVAMAQYLRQCAAIRRLPKMVEQLRELVKRIESLESTANDQGGD